MNWLRNLLPSNSGADQKLSDLENKMGRLIALESDVRTDLENAKYQPGMKSREEVKHWLSNVERTKADLQNMKKEGQAQGSFASNSQQITRIERITKQVEELIQLSKFERGLVAYHHKSTILPLLTTQLVGEMFEINIRKVMGWLESDNQFMVGVYGMGGVGKTTLLMHIHNRLLQDTKIQGCVYWVTVSQNFSSYKLQQDIAKAVGVDLSQEKNSKMRAALLYNSMAMMGRSVLILDDLWESFEICDIIGIPCGSSTCKIILTTRSLEVCRRMRCKDFVIKAETLSEPDAWELFAQKLDMQDALIAEVEPIARSVAKACGGLPLAIITMARSLTGIVDIEEWKNALDELRRPCRRQVDMEVDVLSVLQYSYDRLNDKVVQNCFLSCILYAEDEKILRKELIEIWINEGLLDEIESREEKVRKGDVILTRLENLCLLDKTTNRRNERCVKMHDLIREMAIHITEEHPHFIAKAGSRLKEVPDEEDWTEDLAKVSLRYNDIMEIPGDLSPRCPNLSVLIFSRNPLREIPECFFVHMRGLRVLNLSDTWIVRLPDSVSDLENLRALILEDCRYLEYLPSVAKLTKLRLLHLPDCCKMIKVPEGLDKLRRLEEVRGVLVWDFSQLTYFNSFITSAVKICRDGFGIHGEVSDCNCPYCTGESDDEFNRNNCVFICNGEIGEENPTPQLPADTIRHLYILNVEMKGRRRNLGNVLPSLAAATQLKILEIRECVGLEYIWSGAEEDNNESSLSPAVLDTLKELRLRELSELRGIVREAGGGGRRGRGIITHQLASSPSSCPLPLRPASSFSQLKELYILGCPKMKVVFQHNLLQQQQPLLPNLEFLKVENCEEVEEIFESSSSNGACSSNPNPNPNPILALPNLRWIELLGLPKLGSIYRDLLLCTFLEFLRIGECPELKVLPLLSKHQIIRPASSFANLKRLTIEGCPKMKTVFQHNMLQQQQQQQQQPLLPNLEYIEVGCCEEVEEIFESSSSSSSGACGSNPPNPILALPNLKEISLFGLPKLGRIYRGLLLCTSLEDIFIVQCPLLKVLPSRLFASSFSHLKHLRISGCPKMKVVFEHNLLRQLQQQQQQQPLLPHLENIHVGDCEVVEEIFESSSSSGGCGSNPNPILALPNLKRIMLSGLPKLGSIYRGLLLCTPLELLYISNCPELKVLPLLSKPLICDATLPASSFSHLNQLTIHGCPKIKVVFEHNLLQQLQQQQQPLLPNLEKIYVQWCEEVEEVFQSSSSSNLNPILALPNLKRIELWGLPKLGSIYRGLLLCTSLKDITIEYCPRLKVLPLLSKHLICDATPSTLASITKYSANPNWWQPLLGVGGYPEGVPALSHFIHQAQPPPIDNINNQDDDDHNSQSKLKRKWGQFSSLSPS